MMKKAASGKPLRPQRRSNGPAVLCLFQLGTDSTFIKRALSPINKDTFSGKVKGATAVFSNNS